MSYDLIFLLEEPSAKIVLETLLPKLLPGHLSYKCISHQGKQDLAKRIPITIKSFSYSPQTQFVILHDQDSHDCKQLKAELQQLCAQAASVSGENTRYLVVDGRPS